MMSCTQPIRRAAQVTPNNVALICGDRKHTFSETQHRISCVARFLVDGGFKEGDRAALLALNSDRYYEIFFAIPWSGGVVVPLNIRWSLAELLYSLNDSGTSVMFVDDMFVSLAEKINDELGPVIRFIYIGDGACPEWMSRYDVMMDVSEPLLDAGRCGDDLLGIFYTGGTTGFPKGVMLSHNNFYSSALSMMSEMGIRTPYVRYLHAAPMFHIADAAVGMANTLAGNTHVFIPAFEPSSVMNAIAKFEVTDVLLVPTMIGMLLEHEGFASAKLGSLKKIVYGASPMPLGVLHKVMEKLSHVALYQAYGQTELAPVISILRPEHHVLTGDGADKVRSAGQASVIVEIKVIDSDGAPLLAGEVGEVLVKGPNTMLGYWEMPEQTKSTINDGWVHTGDAGYLDDDGFLFLVDRVKDMIVTGGENVFSAEVENVVSQHPAVQEVAVIGIPHPKWGESVHAVVRLSSHSSASEKELIEYCRAAIAAYKCPRSVTFVSDPLPTTSVGKISKKDIRKPYWNDSDKAIN
jgi:acyl-CoA synthetase (AMP-forming)/AMP-acid ligase II